MCICPSCVEQLAKNNLACQRCATPLGVNDHNHNNDDLKLLCGNCQQKPPFFDQALSPFLYQDKMIYLIHQFKYQQKIFLARNFAQLFLQQNNISAQNQHPDLLLPVPLYQSKIKQRGYNQANEIARFLSQQLNIELNYQLIKRVIDTKSQRHLKSDARRKNVENAFTLTSDNTLIKNKHLVIIDDVMTTGSTVNAIAKLLKTAGATRVDVWTIARAG